MKLKYIKLFEEFETGDRPPIDATNRLAKIMKLPYEVFVQKLGDLASDPKFQAAMKGGRVDGNPNDEKFEFESPKFLPVTDLFPTQNEIDVDKSLMFQLSGKDPKTKDIFEGKNVTIVGPIVTFNNKYIIDGHHRWSQVYATNVDCKIECLNFNTKQSDPILVLKAVQIAIAAAMGKVPTEHVEGGNLLEIDQDSLEEYVAKKISNTTYSLMKQISPQGVVISEMEDATSYFWRNVKLMQENNASIPGAPDRGVMPQTGEDKTGEWAEKMQTGEVNFVPRFRAE